MNYGQKLWTRTLNKKYLQKLSTKTMNKNYELDLYGQKLRAKIANMNFEQKNFVDCVISSLSSISDSRKGNVYLPKSLFFLL